MAYPMRDYFKNYFQWPNWVCWVLPIEITLSFSAAYELIEWIVAGIFFPSERKCLQLSIQLVRRLH